MRRAGTGGRASASVLCTKTAFSSESGKSESLSALLRLPRACSRRKNTINVKTRQRLIVRVKGTTVMVESAGCTIGPSYSIGSGSSPHDLAVTVHFLFFVEP